MTISIALTGPESSGKSSLAQSLAEKFEATLVKEFARAYLRRNPEYDAEDLLYIAKQQYEQIEAAKQSSESMIISDTEMIVMKIWYQEKYMQSSVVIDQLLAQQNFDLYLLTKPDIPWSYDPLRENPLDRDRLFNLYLDMLESEGFPYMIVSGTKKQRIEIASNAIQAII